MGPKTALRFVYALLAKSPTDVSKLARTLLALHDHIKACQGCGAFTSANPCNICKDPKRDAAMICVVAESRDISTIEGTGEYNGRYHVLGGLLSPLEGSTPDTLRIGELFSKLSQGTVKEVVLAISHDLRGESTMLYLGKRLAQYPAKITRLARGLPLGADIEYADEVTLADALRGRKEIEIKTVDK